MMSSRTIATLLLPFALGCSPTFEDRPWRIDDARVLAIAVTPAEALPGEFVSLDALVVDPDGPRPGVLEWSVCTEPRTARERGAVSERCARGEQLEAVSNPAPLLSDACARFGPNPPPTEGGEPARRPADPDPTGGYFLPVRVHDPADALQSFGFARIRCDLAGVTRAVFEDYLDRYSLNTQPTIDRLERIDEATPRPLGIDAPPTVDRAQSVELRLTTAAGASEPYVILNEDYAALLDRREALTVRWYVTDGRLDQGEQTREGTALDEAPASFEVQWTAPVDPGRVHGWAVLVDDRGGVVWTAFAFDVR